VPVVFQGLSDIAAMSGRGAEAIGSLTLAFSQIMGRGRLQAQELNQITEAAGGAVSRLKLFKEIARIMGVSENSIESMMENGLIPARVAIMGVMNVAKNLGGGVLGRNSIEQSKTLAGLWSNLQDTITNLWLTMDIANAPWFKAVKSFMGGLVEALDSSSRAGKALQGVFNRLFTKTIADFLGTGTEDPSNKIIELALAFEAMAMHAISAFKGLWEGLKTGFAPLIQGLGAFGNNEKSLQATQKIFERIGEAVASIALGLTTIAAAINGIAWFFGSSPKPIMDPATIEPMKLSDIGKDAFWKSKGWKEFWGIGDEAGQGLNAGFANATEIRSPSKVFQRFGEQTVAGYDKGLEDSGGLMSGVSAAELATTTGGRVGPGGGAANVTLNINVDATGGASADSIAQRLRELLPSTLAGVFDQMATEGGVA
jgi:tape measure domain-containing protein